jgi:hypothetical protein
MLLVHMCLYNLEYISFSNVLEKDVLKRDWPIICGNKFVSFLIDRFDYGIVDCQYLAIYI